MKPVNIHGNYYRIRKSTDRHRRKIHWIDRTPLGGRRYQPWKVFRTEEECKAWLAQLRILGPKHA